MTASPPVTLPDDLTDDLFHKIAKQVYDLAGIHLTENKYALVRARIGKIIRQRGLKGFQDYYLYLTRDTTGEAKRELLNAISTNLTSFFREPKHFDFLREKLLPEILRQGEAIGDRRLRAWSAGCSSGEEVYTLAITIAEAIPLASWDVKLLASDIDTEMLARGKRGIYPEDRIQTVPPPLLHRYFLRAVRDGKRFYRVKDEIRRLIRFRFLNLMDPWPFRGTFDFIFCRNVMIYFDRPTQESLINRFYSVLKPGGHLFIGHSEGLSGIRHAFSYGQPTIYVKK